MTGNQSLERGLAILDLVDRAPAPLGIREMARALALSPTIVQRLSNSLAKAGYLEQMIDTRRYKLGYRAAMLARAATAGDQLKIVATKELQRLADDRHLNGYLGILRDNQIFYVLNVQSSGPIALRAAVGDRVNAHSTALGKALIAELPVTEVKAVVGRAPYEQCTPNTITQWNELAAELDRVRRSGFAVSQGENIYGVVSFGAVIRDASGKSVAALSVASLASGEKREKTLLPQLVIDAAHRCSLALGYTGAAIRLSPSRIDAA